MAVVSLLPFSVLASILRSQHPYKGRLNTMMAAEGDKHREERIRLNNKTE
jgi:hypothetical protein